MSNLKSGFRMSLQTPPVVLSSEIKNYDEAKYQEISLSSEVFRDPAEKFMEVWRVKIQGRIIPACWFSKGAALAGLKTEIIRIIKKAGRK